MKKTFVIDTNILMSYPDAITKFEDNLIVLPGTVLEELDNIKSRAGESGMQARQAISALGTLKANATGKGNIAEDGIIVNKDGGRLRVELDHLDPTVLPQGWSLDKPDNRILSVCKCLNAILVSEDSMMLFKAFAIGVQAQRYRNACVEVDDTYTGRGEIYLPDDAINTIMKEGVVKADMRTAKKLIENEYLIAYGEENTSHQILCRYGAKAYHKLLTLPEKCKIKPKNVAQQFAIDALLSDIPAVALEGAAGTSKTFLSVVCAMQGLQMGKWEQIIATRNNQELDSHGLGALPGNELEKCQPLLRGLIDNLKTYLKIQGTDSADIAQLIDDYLESQVISIEALSFMRGRSITDSILLVEEAQNASGDQMMALLTRLTESSKVAINFDPHQIDNPRLTKSTCGGNITKAAMIGSPNFAYIKFDDEKECVRSPLAKDAAARFAAILAKE